MVSLPFGLGTSFPNKKTGLIKKPVFNLTMDI